jgi:hypothetical protein
MSPTDPQFIYMVLILPTLFGLTLVGEGVYKIMHQEYGGILSLIFGTLFIGVVGFAFFFFSTMLKH